MSGLFNFSKIFKVHCKEKVESYYESPLLDWALYKEL
jgi:hypothetical protein